MNPSQIFPNFSTGLNLNDNSYPELHPIQPYVPKLSFSIEFAQQLLDALGPVNLDSPEPRPSKNLPIDRNFLRLLDSLKPSPISASKPDGVLSEEQLKEYHALRMREYRRKSIETVEKTKALKDELQLQLRTNAVKLKGMMESTEVEEEVKRAVAERIGLDDTEKVMEIQQIQGIFQKYWMRKRKASESGYEIKSLFYWTRVVQLQTKYSNFKGERSPSEHTKKVRDATMKAMAYDIFMDDKRVRKVIREFENAGKKLRIEVGKWLQNKCTVTEDAK